MTGEDRTTPRPWSERHAPSCAGYDNLNGPCAVKGYDWEHPMSDPTRHAVIVDPSGDLDPTGGHPMSDPIREALRDVLSVNHSPFLGSDGIRPCLCVVHETARDALSTTPAPLDVERLRRAIYAVSVRHDWANTTDTEDRTEEIAAEYAKP